MKNEERKTKVKDRKKKKDEEIKCIGLTINKYKRKPERQEKENVTERNLQK